MRVTSYGLFWSADEIDWFPGKGNKGQFQLLGRVGSNRGSIKMADFRNQQGIYVLYDDYGPSYVGLTRDQGLGVRLKQHTEDRLADKWTRFSWFGFRPILKSTDRMGMTSLGESDLDVTEDTHTTIGDLEALLIRAIGPKDNVAKMRFNQADEWKQVALEEIEKFRARLEAD